MRQVDRSLIPIPPTLNKEFQDETETIRQGGTARGGIYRADDVLFALRVLYRDKCYLCEGYVGIEGVVEHFLPWHKQFPCRAYDWDNLHLCCDRCNRQKRKSPYRYPSDSRKPAQETRLIDPSNPPGNHLVSDLIGFDDTGYAEKKGLYDSQDKVKNTQDFLNEAGPLKHRLNRHRSMQKVWISLLKTHASKWGKLQALFLTSSQKWTKETIQPYVSVLQQVDNIYRYYLTECAPFSTSIHVAFEDMCDCSIAELQQMSDVLRQLRKQKRICDLIKNDALCPPEVRPNI